MAIEDVKTTDSLDSGRLKWNNNDFELKNSIAGHQILINNATSRLDIAEINITTLQSAHQLSVKRSQITDSDVTAKPSGWTISFGIDDLSAGYSLDNGSVQVSVNGLVYTSKKDQTQTGADFAITSNSIEFYNVANGGSLDLIDSDLIIIHYVQVKA